MRSFVIALTLLLAWSAVRADQRDARLLTVATYNVENLFDTLNDPGINDLVLSPAEYRSKIGNLSKVLADLNADVMALSEIENAGVITDLIESHTLRNIPYDFAHYDSPDRRGIDVALIFRTDKLSLVESEPVRAPGNYLTRDILRAVFSDNSTGTTWVFYAVHLPSRRGGYRRAARAREQLAALLDLKVRNEPAGYRTVVLGDFNANPDSKIVKALDFLHCATLTPYRKGAGSYAWRDTWQMYDNIIIGRNIEYIGEARVFIRPYLLTPEGRFKGYPYRSVYSDHLPVYIQLVR